MSKIDASPFRAADHISRRLAASVYSLSTLLALLFRRRMRHATMPPEITTIKNVSAAINGL